MIIHKNVEVSNENYFIFKNIKYELIYLIVSKNMEHFLYINTESIDKSVYGSQLKRKTKDAGVNTNKTGPSLSERFLRFIFKIRKHLKKIFVK